MAEIKHLLHINAPANKIYQAITEEEGLRNWWTNQTIASPVEGATINATIDFPKLQVTKTALTNASGTALVTYKVNTIKTGTGTATATLTANLAGYDTGTTTLSFTTQ